MASEQAAYHSGLEAVRNKLEAQSGLTAVAKAKVEEAEKLHRVIEQKCLELAQAVGALAVHHRTETVPAFTAARDAATEARQMFHAAVPIITGRRALKDIADALANFDTQWHEEGGVIRGAGDDILWVTRLAASVQVEGLTPLGTALESIPGHYDSLTTQNQAIIGLLDRQEGVT